MVEEPESEEELTDEQRLNNIKQIHWAAGVPFPWPIREIEEAEEEENEETE